MGRKRRRKNSYRFKTIDPMNPGRVVTKATGRKIKRIKITRPY